MTRKSFLYILLIFLTGCAFINILIGEEENIAFKGKQTNQFFNYRQLMHQNVAILPIRGSMGGGGGDDRLNAILVQTIKEKLPGIYLISDDSADKYFTENDMWDDYFSYVSLHAAKGLVEIDILIDLYSNMQVTTIFSITSDFRFSAVEGMFPRNFNTFVSLQILDLRSKQIIWDGLVDAQEVVESKEEEDETARKTFKKVADRVLAEVMR
jgi:hypothetical protein